MIFHEGIELPHFAAFDPMRTAALDAVNAEPVAVLLALREREETPASPMVVSGAGDLSRVPSGRGGLAAERQGRGARGLSLIVADRNFAAQRLYEAWGLAETAREAMVKKGWQSASSEWVLMPKPAR